MATIEISMSREVERNENDGRHSGHPETPKVTKAFHKYHSPLKRFIENRVPSQEDCEDILQDVFYQLAKIDQEENPIEQVSAWLYRVARNLIVDRSRKHREENSWSVQKDEEDEFVSNIAAFMLDEDASPEMDLLKSVMWEELGVALAELPLEQRSVFELTELEGFSFKEISESTGIPVNTLLSRKHYAVMHLRKSLGRLYEEFLEL